MAARFPRMNPERLRGFGPEGLAAIVLILAAAFVSTALGAVLVLVWARVSLTPWADLGFARPKSWWACVAIGVTLGVGLKLVLKSLVMPWLGAPAMNAHFAYLVGNTAALPGMAILLFVDAGFGEETFFRGYLFERLGRLLGPSRAARAVILVLTSALFAAAHLTDQGVPGAEQALLTGLTFGTVYLATRQLWIPMIAHVAYDVTAVAMIYSGWESRVAHWFFR